MSMIVLCSCERAESEENINRAKVDSVRHDTLPYGFVRYGDLVINTNWIDENDVKF